MYNLSSASKLKYDYTVLMPTDDAIRQYLSKTNQTVLVGADAASLPEVHFNFNSTIQLRNLIFKWLSFFN